MYAIAGKRFTGDFALVERGMRCRITWRDGLVVAASSENPADSAARVALTAGLLTSTQVAEVVGASARAPGRSQVELIAELAGLSDKQRAALARRALLQRAIRAFALPEASFELNAHAVAPGAAPGTAPVSADLVPIAVRTLIFHGLQAHYDEARLEAEMAAVAGAQFQLRAGAGDIRQRLAEYGFTDRHLVCVRQLAGQPHTVAELEQALPGTARKDILLVVYALLSTDDVKARRKSSAGSRRAETVQPEAPSIPTDEAPEPAPGARAAGEAPRRRARDATRAAEIRDLIRSRLGALDGGCDYYQLLGVARDVDTAGVRRAYFALAKRLHPDRLRALAIDDDKGDAQRLFATVNKAFAVLGKDAERARYDAALAGGGTGDKARDRLAAEKQAMKVISAEEHFLRGEQALRGNRIAAAQAEFARAVELNPDEAEHHALLAWATWCNASDKNAVRARVRSGLERALQLSEKCAPAYFYRGQLASADGDQERALDDFRHVLRLQPSHREADLQVRLIESRLARSGGVFGRKKSR